MLIGSSTATTFQASAQIAKTQATQSFSEVYAKSAFKPVPDNIHMVWVGSKPGDKQQEYVKQWAAKNPGSHVNLWVDSQHFGAYAANTAVREEVEKMFPDSAAYKSEKLMRGLFSQVAATLGKGSGSVHQLVARNQALAELNKELSAKGNEHWKEALLPQGGKVGADNAAAVLDAFRHLVRGNDEKFLNADGLIFRQTVEAWDRSAPGSERDVDTLNLIRARFADSPNVHIRDLSNPGDIELRNRDAYRHEIVGRNGAYPAASDIARYEILHTYGGVYSDIDLECLQPLAGMLPAHPDLMLVGLAVGKREASGSVTPYFANALLASHPGSKMLNSFIEKIGGDYSQMKGNEFAGDRYFSRPNKFTIENTGPNALRGHVDAVVRKGLGQPELTRCDAQSLAERIWDTNEPRNRDFWAAVESHFKFPDGFVNFETEEQQKSATKSMA
jgi:hypothetical protein